MTVLPGMGYFPDRPIDPPEGPDDCPECGSANVSADQRERTFECHDCGYYDAYDWDTEAERRAGL